MAYDKDRELISAALQTHTGRDIIQELCGEDGLTSMKRVYIDGKTIMTEAEKADMTRWLAGQIATALNKRYGI